MSEKRYKVSDELKRAANDAYCSWPKQGNDRKLSECVAEAVLRHLSEHPKVPTDEQMANFLSNDKSEWNRIRDLLYEWQRIAYLDEPEVPEGIKDLLWREGTKIVTNAECMNDKLLEAYERGRKAGK
jgi:hypothetical protein